MNYQSWIERTNRRAREYLGALKEMLDVENLAVVTVTYSGSGDSGQFDFESFKKVGGRKVYKHHEAEKKLSRQVDVKVFTSHFDTTTNEWVETFEVQKTELAGWFIDAAHHAVSVWHSGWENNEGGFGTVRFDRAGITVEHSDYVVATEDYTHKWALSDLTPTADNVG